MDNLETDRAMLRRLKFGDYRWMRLLETDPEIMIMTPLKVVQTDEQTMKRFLDHIEKQKLFRPYGYWVAEFKMHPTFIGWFMLIPTENNRLELGFMILREHWGIGLATEIASALTAFVKSEKEIKIIKAQIKSNNISSIKVLQKLGFSEIDNVLPSREVSIIGELKCYEF